MSNVAYEVKPHQMDLVYEVCGSKTVANLLSIQKGDQIFIDEYNQDILVRHQDGSRNHTLAKRIDDVLIVGKKVKDDKSNLRCSIDVLSNVEDRPYLIDHNSRVAYVDGSSIMAIADEEERKNYEAIMHLNASNKMLSKIKQIANHFTLFNNHLYFLAHENEYAGKDDDFAKVHRHLKDEGVVCRDNNLVFNCKDEGFVELSKTYRKDSRKPDFGVLVPYVSGNGFWHSIKDVLLNAISVNKEFCDYVFSQN